MMTVAKHSTNKTICWVVLFCWSLPCF